MICGHKQHGGVVADFCDSKHAASHVLWSSGEHALQIFMYFDELELCNPLGASRKIQKIGTILDFYLHFISTIIGCFYFTIGNIHHKFRSTLKSIQLLALVKNEHLKKYGMNNI